MNQRKVQSKELVARDRRLFVVHIELKRRTLPDISKIAPLVSEALNRVAELCHFEAAPAPTPAQEPPVFFTAPEQAPAPTYLLHAWVGWGRIRPAVVVLINSTNVLSA